MCRYLFSPFSDGKTSTDGVTPLSIIYVGIVAHNHYHYFCSPLPLTPCTIESQEVPLERLLHRQLPSPPFLGTPRDPLFRRSVSVVAHVSGTPPPWHKVPVVSLGTSTSSLPLPFSQPVFPLPIRSVSLLSHKGRHGGLGSSDFGVQGKEGAERTLTDHCGSM